MRRAPRNVSAWRDLIGKAIQYTLIDKDQVHEGVVQEVKRKNIRIGGEWYWRDDIEKVSIVHDPKLSPL